jgi:dolichol kinase
MRKTANEGKAMTAKQITISVGALAEIKKKALRRRAWFKVLDGMERAIVSLTIRCVESIKSPKLANIVTAIVTKLIDAMTSQVEKLKETVGSSLVRNLAKIALAWGNFSAKSWVEDKSFIQYLVIMRINTPKMFQV